MINSSLGDMARSFLLQQRSSAVRSDITRFTEELSTGQVSDVRDVLGGNTRYLTELERSMTVLQGYSVAVAEAAQFTESMQAALGRVQEIGEDVGGSLVLLSNETVPGSSVGGSIFATEGLTSIISILNSDVAGRSIFSGAATDRAPLAGAEDILAGLRTALTGITEPDAIVAATETWFDDPAGFLATAYQGSADPIAPFALSDQVSVSLDVRADDKAIRNIIQSLAMSAVIEDDSFGLSRLEQVDILKSTATDLLSGQSGITSLRADVGFSEARIEQTKTRNAAELTSTEFALGNLLSVDPFEAATRLDDAQFKLESLYTATVRTSQLSLVNFL